MPAKAVTIRDVAQAAGVSKTTAVYILNNAPHFNVPEATRRRVQDAASQLGYRRNAIAAALSRGRIHTIGVAMPFTPDSSNLSNPNLVYAKAMLVAVAAAAQRVGLRITLVPVSGRGPVAEEEVTDGRVDGLILIQIHDPESVRSLYDSGLPCVAITAEHCPLSVRPDNRGGARLAVEHLVALGHRRIAHRTILPQGEAARERARGFCDAVREFGLNPAECPVVASGQGVTDLLDLHPDDRPTALFAFNDELAIETMRLARRLGLRVPEDLSVLGFDNNVLAEVCEPPLTTVHNPVNELADAAIAALSALWEGKEPVLPAPIPTRLVVRHSTAPANPPLEEPSDPSNPTLSKEFV